MTSRLTGLCFRSVEACPRCGEPVSGQARFCQSCGAELRPAAAGREERKLVSVLFVDLVGFTSRSDRADPEDVRDVLQLYHSRAKRQIEEYGGAVEKFIGDAVMAVFGAPLGHGDDAERAVRAGLRVLDGIAELNQEHPGLELAARAAVNTGEAVVSIGAGHESGEALAMGDAVNVASRLQTAAPPGRLIVGEETYRSTRHVISYEELAPIVAKGKREPLRSWLAVAPMAAPADRPVTATPLVGREHEMALLESIWERAVRERRTHLLTVMGPAGIGKSRLSREMSALVEGKGGRAVRGRCLPYEERIGYSAFTEQVRNVAGIFESDPPHVAREKLDRTVAALLPAEEVSEVARYLSLLLGLGVDAPTRDRTYLFFAARRLVENLALQQPTMFVFEDVHWADQSQLDLLDYLASRVRDAAAVLLILARPELLDTRPSWGTGHLAHTTIPLEPLSVADAATVASHALGGHVLASAVERIVEVAEGNPLFLEELAGSLSEGLGEAQLPTTIRAAIASRIDSLPPQVRRGLLDASVIGKTFWKEMLRVVGELDDVDAVLEALEQRDFVRRVPSSQLEGDVEFTFKHILIRDVAYGTLPRAERRERHGAVARYVEEAVGERTSVLAWLLAHHWNEAGDPARAVDYLLAAAKQSRERWAKQETLDLYTKAIELVGELDQQRGVQIRLLRALALVDLSDFKSGAAELDEILPSLEGRQEMEALFGRARAAFWLADTDSTLRSAQRAKELAEQLGDREFLGPSLGFLSAGHGMRGHAGDIDRALELGNRAIEVWVPGARPIDLAVVKNYQANHYYWTGDYQTAAELARSTRELGGTLHSAEALIRGGGLHGLTLAAMGKAEEALALLDSVISRAREMEVPGWLPYPLNNSTMVLRDLFLLEEARRRNEEAVELVRQSVGWGMPLMQGQIDLIFTDLLEREVGRAQRDWPGLWETAVNGGAWNEWLGTGRLAVARAEIALQAEGPEQAVEEALKAIELARQGRRLKYETLARTILGTALVALDRWEEGLGELRTAVEGANRLGTPSGRWDALGALGKALYTRGDDDGAATAYHQAAEAIRAFASTLTAEHAKSLLAAPSISDILSASA
jgi:class 3 adenylate cyclase/tetratricopeptide (TPR) repeat protein